MKQGVTPHKFACQSRGIASAQILEKRSALQRKRSLKEMFNKNVDVMHQPGKNMNVLCLNFIYRALQKKCHSFKHLPFPNYLTYILLLSHVW